jgi:tRNA(fMet)-specific endonuclease VapC
VIIRAKKVHLISINGWQRTPMSCLRFRPSPSLNWHGVERATGARRTARERYLRALIDALPIIPYTEQTAYHHARLWAQLESCGKMIGPYDLIVAATALERESELATFNQHRFANVKELKVIEPKF